jgi:uncharacterized protein YciI
MLLVAIFEDHPDRIAVRRERMIQHLDFLRLHADVIRTAGSLRAQVDGDPVGAMWILDVPDVATAEALIAADPFTIGGLRRGYRLLLYTKAFAEMPPA